MIAQRHSIFREKAFQHYTQGKKKDVLPNFSSVPVAIFLVVLLASFTATGLVAWRTQVPVYLPGMGILLGTENHSTVELAFLSQGTPAKLTAGQSILIQTSSTGPQIVSTITEVTPEATTLASVFKQIGAPAPSSSAMNLPAIILQVSWNAALADLSPGRQMIVQVAIRTRPLFVALTGLGN